MENKKELELSSIAGQVGVIGSDNTVVIDGVEYLVHKDVAGLIMNISIERDDLATIAAENFSKCVDIIERAETAEAKLSAVMPVIQVCFEDACSPTGKISKKAAIELMKHADTKA